MLAGEEAGKCTVRVCWTQLAGFAITVFNSNLWENFSQIPEEVGNIKFLWTLFYTSIVAVAARS